MIKTAAERIRDMRAYMFEYGWHKGDFVPDQEYMEKVIDTIAPDGSYTTKMVKATESAYDLDLTIAEVIGQPACVIGSYLLTNENYYETGTFSAEGQDLLSHWGNVGYNHGDSTDETVGRAILLALADMGAYDLFERATTVSLWQDDKDRTFDEVIELLLRAEKYAEMADGC